MTLPAALLLLLLAGEGDGPPRDLPGWIERQDRQILEGKRERALGEAKERAEKEPANAEALYLHGRILGNCGKVDEARARFQAALDLDPDYAPAWEGMARVHLLERKFDLAVREARKARELRDSRENLELLAQALYFSGDRPGAYRILQEGLARTPGDGALRRTYATLLHDEGLLRDAEREARLVLAGDGEDLRARALLVAILASTARKDEAVAEAREIVRRRPKDPDGHLLLLRLLLAERKHAAAVTVLEDLLRLEIPAELRSVLEKDLATIRRALATRDPGADAGPAAAEPDAKEILERLESKDVAVRRAAMRTLLGYRLNYLPATVLRRLGDEDEEVRDAAVRLLDRYGKEEHLGLLDLLLFRAEEREPSLAVRVRAVRAIGRIGSPIGLLLLLRGVGEPEPEMLKAVLASLRDITGKSFLDDLDAPIPDGEGKAIRERVAKWWFEDRTARVWRRKAAAALAEGEQRSLAGYLVPWVDEEEPEIRAAMLDAMARLSGDASWKGLPSSTKEERAAAKEKAFAWLLSEEGR